MNAAANVADASAARSSAHPLTGGINPWFIAVTVLLGTFLAVMDLSVVNVALPHMMGSFGQDLSAITWVATSYSIAEIIMATMAGWWSTLIGRRNLYVISLIVFIAGSVLCGLAQNFPEMLIFRVIQGIGGGPLIPIGLAILRESFPPRQQGLAMSVYGMGVVLAPAFGPVFGGWLTDHYGWPAIFYINVPFGILAVMMALAFIHDPADLRRGIRHIDWVSIILLTACLTGMQIVLERGQEADWFASNAIIFGTVATLVTLVALVIWDLYSPDPVVNFRLLRNIPLAAGSAIGIVFGLSLYGTTFILPSLTQNLMGYPAFEAGMVLLPRAITLFLCMPIAGALFGRIDARALMLMGLTIILWSFWDLGRLSLAAGFWTFVPILLIMGAGMPFMFVTLTTVSLSTLPRGDLTHGSALYTLSRRIGGNIGYALCTTILARQTQVHHVSLARHINPANPAYQDYMQTMTHRLTNLGMPAINAPTVSNAIANHMLNQQASMMSYNDVAWFMGALFLLCIPMVFLLPGGRHNDSHGGGGHLAAE